MCSWNVDRMLMWNARECPRWELQAGWKLPVSCLFFLFCLVPCFLPSFPHHPEIQICSLMGLSQIQIFSKRDENSLMDGNIVVLPFCFSELEFLVRTRKDSPTRKKVIQVQLKETVHIQADFQKRPWTGAEPFKDSSAGPFCLERKRDLVGVYGELSERKKQLT